jgi:hypothetical protein
MQARATPCMRFASSESSAKAPVKTIANWKPSNVCAPGRTTRASVRTYSILVAVDVSRVDHGRLLASRSRDQRSIPTTERD